MYNYCDKRFLFLFPYLYSILMTQVFLPALIVVQFATLGELRLVWEIVSCISHICLKKW